MKHKAKLFTFVSRAWNKDTGQAEFVYSVVTSETSYTFTERLQMPVGKGENIVPPMLIDACLDALHLILGISYWKAFCPPAIELKNIVLNVQQAEFWNTVYEKGLGEFFYRNGIDFHNLISFPIHKDANPTATVHKDVKGGVLGLGGGKDSVVAVEMLKQASYPFQTFVVETQTKYSVVRNTAEHIGKQTYYIQRTIDPLLFELNASGTVYNGHIPVSAIYAFIGYFLAVLHGLAYVIVPNEHSANSGNVEYLGMTVNHQWSKSYEFETKARNYMKHFMSPSVSYVSILRPLSELKIMSYMAGLSEYLPIFSSCNNNFKMLSEHKTSQQLWCGKCPKCAFVFSCLAAYIPLDAVTEIFHKNLFMDEALIPLYRDLLGIGTMKPFECVGTFEENQAAFCMIMKRGEDIDTPVMRMFTADCLPHIPSPEELVRQQTTADSSVVLPEEFATLIQTYEDTRVSK